MRVRTAIEPKSMAEFQTAMNNLSAMSRTAMVDIGLKQAQLICRDMMSLTPPMGAGGKGGLTATGEKAGKRSVERDIRKLYVAMDGNGNAPMFLFQQRLALAVKSNNSAEFDNLILSQNRKILGKLSPVLQKICADYDLDRAMKKAKNWFARSSPQRSQHGSAAGGYAKDMNLHQLMLDKTGGRFRKNGKPFNPLRSWIDKQIVPFDSQLVSYIQKRQSQVGRLKAGWWDAMQLIPNPSSRGKEKEYGRAGVGDWIKAQATSQGRFTMAKGTNTVSMTVGNMIGDLNNVSTEANTKSLVLGIRTANIQRDIEQRVRKLVEQVNNKQLT